MNRPLLILYLEDNPRDAELVRDNLRQASVACELRVACDRAEYEAALVQTRFDLIFSDYRLPNYDGMAALALARERQPEVPFILISGTLGEEMSVDCMSRGATDYVLKTRLDRLVPAVVRALKEAEEHRKRREVEQEREHLLRWQQGLNRVQQSLLAPASLEDKLRQVTDSIVRLFGADFCRIWLIEAGDRCDGGCVYAGGPEGPQVCGDRSRCLHLRASSGRYTHLDGKGHRRVPLGAYNIGRLASGEAHKFLTNDAPNDPLIHDRAWALELGLVSFAGYQLRIPGGATLGVLALFAKDPILPAEDALLEGLSGTLAQVIQENQAQDRILKQAALLDATHDAICVRGLDHTVRYWNRGAERLYGWTSAEALGRKITDLGSLELAAFETAHAALLNQGAWTGELPMTTRAGQPLILLCRWTLLRDAQGQPEEVLGITTDLTEHKKLEAEFFRAQRLESIGALASGLAHDLNNVLTPMLMITSLLRGTVQDAESREMLDTIETGAQRGADIIKQLLIFGRGEPGARIRLPVGHFLRDLEKLIRETFPRNLRPSVQLAKDLWPTLGDATQFHQVVMNLCVNARDAMPEGGDLRMGAKNVSVDESFARMTPGAQPGPYVCVSVTDTGTGIPPENLARIFDPFFTTKEIGKGTGLGLSTVLGIVRGHGGFMRVDSRLGRGTTFEVYFPATPQAPAAEAAVVPLKAPRGQGELILVVDDEAMVRDVLHRTLEIHGYRVVTANDGAQGLAAFFCHRAEVRAILTDMMMPVMNGPTMVNALRAHEPGLPILGMTGLTERTGVKDLEHLSLAALLAKPFSGDELLRTVHDSLQAAGKAGPRKEPGEVGG